MVQNLVTLAVEHRGIAAETGQPFVYPVVAGTGWQGGWIFGTVEKCVPEEEEAEEEEGGEGENEEGGSSSEPGSNGALRQSVIAFSAPVERSSSWAPDAAKPTANGAPQSLKIKERKYAVQDCRRDPYRYQGGGGGGTRYDLPNFKSLGECRPEWIEKYWHLRWATSAWGTFFYTDPSWKTWVKHEPRCKAWGPDPYPVSEKKGCEVAEWSAVLNSVNHNVDVISDWRFKPNQYELTAPLQATCLKVDGSLPLHPDGSVTQTFSTLFHEYKDWIWPTDQCPWNQL
jgi:hypothetical protein